MLSYLAIISKMDQCVCTFKPYAQHTVCLYQRGLLRKNEINFYTLLRVRFNSMKLISDRSVMNSAVREYVNKNLVTCFYLLDIEDIKFDGTKYLPS